MYGRAGIRPASADPSIRLSFAPISTEYMHRVSLRALLSTRPDHHVQRFWPGLQYTIQATVLGTNRLSIQIPKSPSFPRIGPDLFLSCFVSVHIQALLYHEWAMKHPYAAMFEKTETAMFSIRLESELPSHCLSLLNLHGAMSATHDALSMPPRWRKIMPWFEDAFSASTPCINCYPPM